MDLKERKLKEEDAIDRKRWRKKLGEEELEEEEEDL